MAQRSVTHATFMIERSYPASPARVFAAWSTAEAKSRWFAGPPDWKQALRELDFRVGGRERLHGIFPSGRVHAFDACFLEIVPNERIIYSYDMYIDEVRLSVSLATIQFKPDGSGTRLIMTEQGAFLDGHEKPELREHGTKILLDKLGAALQG